MVTTVWDVHRGNIITSCTKGALVSIWGLGLLIQEVSRWRTSSYISLEVIQIHYSLSGSRDTW